MVSLLSKRCWQTRTDQPVDWNRPKLFMGSRMLARFTFTMWATVLCLLLHTFYNIRIHREVRRIAMAMRTYSVMEYSRDTAVVLHFELTLYDNKHCRHVHIYMCVVWCIASECMPWNGRRMTK